LQWRLTLSQGDFIKATSNFLNTLYKTQTECTDIIDKLRVQNKRIAREVLILKGRLVSKERAKRSIVVQLSEEKKENKLRQREAHEQEEEINRLLRELHNRDREIKGFYIGLENKERNSLKMVRRLQEKDWELGRLKKQQNELLVKIESLSQQKEKVSLSQQNEKESPSQQKEKESLSQQKESQNQKFPVSAPILVKGSVKPQGVPVKRIFQPPNLEPRRLKNYIRYINTFVDSVDDLISFESKLAECASIGDDGLLEDDEASTEESDNNKISGDDISKTNSDD